MERLQAGSLLPSSLVHRRTSTVGGDVPNQDEVMSQLRTENQTLQKKCERLQKKEKRIIVQY